MSTISASALQSSHTCLPLALQPAVSFGLSNNALPFFSYLPPTLSIFKLPALEDLFLLPLSIFSWVFPFFSALLVKIFLGIPSFSILSRWPNQLILCPFIHFTIFSPLLVSSSSRLVRLFHSPFSYLGPNMLLNIFLSKISRACSSFFVNVQFARVYIRKVSFFFLSLLIFTSLYLLSVGAGVTVALSWHSISHAHTHTHTHTHTYTHTRLDSSRRVIGSSQRPLRDNTNT